MQRSAMQADSMNGWRMKNGSMEIRLTPVALAVALLVLASGAQAQQQAVAPGTPAPADAPQTVQIKGMRASLQQSLNQKRNADTLVEVVTAEDIGKLPDKNVADAVQRLPGINTSSTSSGEGGFDENDRVSIRGTSASLTQTLINGHSVSTGDWFILSQFGSVGRSVSFTLLPSELVSSVVVHKSASADLPEGGVAGDVNIITRKPLEFTKQLTLEAALGAVYADKPGKTDPQFNALFNWKNEQKTFGAMLQVFSEKRSSRRDGQEIFGYIPIAAGSNAAKADPRLAGVLVPNFIGSALFTQERQRDGGAIALQLKPNKDLSLGVDAFYSKLSASNANINALANTPEIGNVVPTNYTISNGMLTSATLPASAGSNLLVVDSIYRPGSGAKSHFFNVDLRYRLNPALVITAQAGSTKGEGYTSSQPAYEVNINNTGFSYQLNGTSRPASVNFTSTRYNPANASTGGAWENHVFSNDKEKYAQADGEWSLGAGMLDSLKFGLRHTDHTRTVAFPLNGSCLDSCAGNVAVYGGLNYPGNFGAGLGGAVPGSFYFSIDDIRRYNALHSNFSEVAGHYWPGELDVNEKASAAYVMANLQGAAWSGNVGVRYAKADQTSLVGFEDKVSGPGSILGSNSGAYHLEAIKHRYSDVLPSANFKYKLTPDLIIRTSAAKVLARPDYSALGGSVSLDDLTLTGNGGNPDLKPVRSTNLDLSLEWYFAPKALLSLGLFNQQFSSAVSNTIHSQSFYDQLRRKQSTYSVVSPINVKARNKGVELSYQQPIGAGFGTLLNYTWADGKEADGTPMVGNSRNTYNLQGYYEQGPLSARLAYTHRSDYLVGLDRSFKQFQQGSGSLAASINYSLNEQLTLALDGLNLGNETLKYYGENQSQPRAFYSNGRQFYLTLRGKL